MKYSEFTLQSEKTQKEQDTGGKPPQNIQMETEYIALREEKIFRYGYSNQLNTTLLTITLAIFTVGAILFSSGILVNSPCTYYGENACASPCVVHKKIIDLSYFAEYFFASFFLLPCFFAKIIFEYCLRNSLRIGTLSEYIRSNLKFARGSSWEIMKKERKIFYFYKERYGVGGAKDIPICVCFMSCIISIAMCAYFILTSNITLGYIYWILRVIIVVIVAFVVQLSVNKKPKWLYLIIFGINMIINITFANLTNQFIENETLFIIQMVYAEILCFTVFAIPQFAREIFIANCRLKLNEYSLKGVEVAEVNVYNQVIDEMITNSNFIVAKMFRVWKQKNKIRILDELGVSNNKLEET